MPNPNLKRGKSENPPPPLNGLRPNHFTCCLSDKLIRICSAWQSRFWLAPSTVVTGHSQGNPPSSFHAIIFLHPNSHRATKEPPHEEKAQRRNRAWTLARSIFSVATVPLRRFPARQKKKDHAKIMFAYHSSRRVWNNT
jgi:hypothetical protein